VTRILLVDDEPDIRQPVGYALRQNGFEVDCAGDGESALERARSGEYDLLICDVMLPGLLGTDVCRILRAESTLPIILLTAKDAEVDRVVGLELGADDYVTKPFSSAELVSRVRALLRRRELDLTEASTSGTVSVGGLSIDLTRHRVTVDGEVDVSLTPSEFKLLALLAEQPDRVFSREQIMQHLWEASYVGDARACDVHVSNLRRKLERDPANPERLVTVREFGYKLVAA
jgi:two-component system response regulator RegX3